MDCHLKSTQNCGVTGNTIFDAVATVRDVAAYAEYVHLPLYILTLDLNMHSTVLRTSICSRYSVAIALAATLSQCYRIYTPMPRPSYRLTVTYTDLSRYIAVFARGTRSVWPYSRCAFSLSHHVETTPSRSTYRTRLRTGHRGFIRG
jgi:hypothetical protein